MGARDRYNPGWGFGGPRYPGTFLLALQEAFEALRWQSRRWLPAAVECVDAEVREQLLGLENLYRRVRREERPGWPGLLTELLGSVPHEALGAEPPELEKVVERLLVRLGPPFARQQEEADVWCQAVVGQHLVASLVVDYPNSMMYVTEKMVADSGKPGEYWFEQAMENLRELTPEHCLELAHEASGLLQCEVRDAYDSSRALMLDDLLPGYEEHGFFVAIPGRDHLLILPVSARAVGFLPWLRVLAERNHRNYPYPISPEVFWVRQGIWHLIQVDLRGPHPTVSPPPEFLPVLESLAPTSEGRFEIEPDDEATDRPSSEPKEPEE